MREKNGLKDGWSLEFFSFLGLFSPNCLLRSFRMESIGIVGSGYATGTSRIMLANSPDSPSNLEVPLLSE
ncbi:hypothetical protein FQN49_008160, partial [Arthroderma sp. PD_2]